eukprot:2675553-Rhodomonas_salina.3
MQHHKAAIYGTTAAIYGGGADMNGGGQRVPEGHALLDLAINQSPKSPFLRVVFLLLNGLCDALRVRWRVLGLITVVFLNKPPPLLLLLCVMLPADVAYAAMRYPMLT